MEIEKPYWSTGPFWDEESGSYEYNWTLSELLNALLRSDLSLVDLAETGPRSARFFEDHSYEKGRDERLLDWRHNPLAGIPSWLTVVAQKPESAGRVESERRVR